MKGASVTSERGGGNLSDLSATFRWVVGYFCMNSFLKVVVLILVAIIAVKLLPAMLALGCVLGVAVVALGAIGVSMFGALCLASSVLLAVLSPVWVPVLAVIGVIVLIKRSGRRTA
jgi:predicted neutral ceramidase superfamily lipid hydrolase